MSAPTTPSTPSAISDKPDLNEILLSWKGPSHPFKKRDKMFYQTVAALTFLFVVIVFFMHEFLLIGVILSIAFVVYVISTVPPLEVEHKITPLGFENAGRLFRWVELYGFWIEKKWDYTILIIQTRLAFPGQVMAVLNNSDDEKRVKEIVGKYLLFMEKPPKSMVDSFSNWLSNKFPLDSSK
jgi:hypothetical protein